MRVCTKLVRVVGQSHRAFQTVEPITLGGGCYGLGWVGVPVVVVYTTGTCLRDGSKPASVRHTACRIVPVALPCVLTVWAVEAVQHKGFVGVLFVCVGGGGLAVLGLSDAHRVLRGWEAVAMQFCCTG